MVFRAKESRWSLILFFFRFRWSFKSRGQDGHPYYTLLVFTGLLRWEIKMIFYIILHHISLVFRAEESALILHSLWAHIFSITLSLQRVELVFCYSLSDLIGIWESQDWTSFPLNGNGISLTKRSVPLFSPDSFGPVQNWVYLGDTLLTAMGYLTV